MTIEEALQLVEKAKSPKALFGNDPTTKYRELALKVHPDTCGPKLKARAQAAFAKLSTMYAILTKPGASKDPVLIGKWVVKDPLAKGDIADLYFAEHTETPGDAVFKLARSSKDDDLMEAESFALKYIHKTNTNGHNLIRYIPTLLDSFEASNRRVNVMLYSENVTTLSDISIHYPNGIGFRHIVWMANRALSALGFIHQLGIVHGAVVPDHLLYGPVTHSLTLVDWCYSVTAESNLKIPAVVTKYKSSLYPPEVLRKRQACPGTDIYMLMSSLESVAESIPKRFRPLFDWCLLGSAVARASQAWEVQDRFLALAKQEYGEPSYLELKLPVT